MDRFDAIGKLDDELAQGFGTLERDWEIRGRDPVLTLRGEGLEVEVVARDDGRFELAATLDHEQVLKVMSALAARRPVAPAPSSITSSAPGLRTRSRRLAAMV